MLECVVNISEGRDHAILATLAAACGDDLLDLHSDPDHNRSVFTLIGTAAPRRLARSAVEHLDLGHHRGVHPRIGTVDVVPFVPLGVTTIAEAITARDAFGAWAGTELGLPCFTYGPERSLPDVRRGAFTNLVPDYGPSHPHRRAGACAIGARRVLVAYNVWVAAPDLAAVRAVAGAVRGRSVRSLGLLVGERFQVSCNLIDPDDVGPADVTAAVVRAGDGKGVEVTGCELVGLIPERTLARIDRRDWERLDLLPDRTIEARLARRVAR